MSTYKVPVIKKAGKPKEEETNHPRLRLWYLGIMLFFGALLIVSITVGLPNTWQGINFVMAFVSLVFAAIFYFGVFPSRDKCIVNKKEALAKELKVFRKCLKKKGEFESAVEEVLKKIKAVKKEKGDTADTKELEEELLQAKTDLETYKEKVIGPRDTDGEKVYTLNVSGGYDLFADHVVGKENGNKEIRKLTIDKVNECSMPFVGALASMLFFCALGIMSMFDNSLETTGVIFGVFTSGFLFILTACLVGYISMSFELVEPTDQGMKYFWGIPYKIVGPGKTFTPKGLVTMHPFPMVMQYYDIHQDKAMLTGKESQLVTLNISQPWHITNIWEVLDGLGSSIGAVIKTLQGDPEKEKDRGMIGDKVTDIAREFVADNHEINSLDEALQMRKNLAIKIQEGCNKEYSHLGITFLKANTTDIDPSEEMVAALNLKATTQVNIKTTNFQISVAENEAKAVSKTADGEAARIEKEGDAEAKVILAKFKANTDAMTYLKTTGLAGDQLLPIITALIMGEKPIAEIAKGIGDVNLVQIQGIDQFVKMFSNFMPSGGVPEVS